MGFAEATVSGVDAGGPFKQYQFEVNASQRL
jgi:hypothetical protein